MAEYLIQDTTLASIADAIRSKTGKSDPLTPDQMVSEIESITGGGSSDIVLLEKQDVTGFAYDSEFGAFAKHYNPAAFTLEAGKEYRVQWDGEERTCTAYTVTTLGYPIICIGNGAQIGGESAGENFLIAYTPAANHLTLFAIDTKSSHNVGVYEVAKATSDDVRYVTFMSYDGTVKYGVKPVAVGDDCADPIARGLFETPTRESTAQYNYTFNGWATTVNGGAVTNALKAVEEDRTVYANFISALRYYTITYLDTDGSVLKTESLAYGSMPSYVPTKEGVVFDGWTPALTTVTCDTSYSAKWSENITFADATWADIVRIAEAGEAQKYFAIGDEREFEYTISALPPTSSDAFQQITYTTKLRIVGFDYDDLADGSGKAAMSIMSTTGFRSKAATSFGGTYTWGASIVRTKLSEALNGFPEALKTGIKSVNKVTRKYVNGTDATGVETTSDKLWVPSVGEFNKNVNNSSQGLKSEDVEKIYPGANLTFICPDENSVRFRSGSYKTSYYIAYYPRGIGTFRCVQNNSSEGTWPFGFCI